MVLCAEVGNSLLQWLANGLQSNIAHSEIHCTIRINLQFSGTYVSFYYLVSSLLSLDVCSYFPKYCS
jgi:hypothetical protein